MMTRIASLVAVLGISLAGAACQSSGTNGFSAENDQNLNSTNTASSTDINNSSDKLNVHNNMHDSSGSLNTNGTANER
jgi:hypothetical protein